MLYAIFTAAALALVAIAIFVWTVVRSAVRQITANGRAGHLTVAAWWTPDADQPVDYWPTYTDPRAVDLDAVPVDEPLTGATAQAMRDALRTDPAKVGRSYDEINKATGGRGWEELKHKSY